MPINRKKIKERGWCVDLLQIILDNNTRCEGQKKIEVKQEKKRTEEKTILHEKQNKLTSKLSAAIVCVVSPYIMRCTSRWRYVVAYKDWRPFDQPATENLKCDFNKKSDKTYVPLKRALY